MYLLHQFFRLFRIVAIPFLALFSVGEVSAGQCLNDSREVTIKGKVFSNGDEGATIVRFRDYLCQRDEGPVRVQFHRINDRTMGELVAGVKNPSTEPLFGRGRVLKNSIYKEYKNLIDRFGVHDGGFWFKMDIATPAGDKIKLSVPYESENEYDGPQTSSLQVLVTNQMDSPSIDFSQPDAMLHLHRTNKLPRGYYGNPAQSKVWTYMKRADADNYYNLIRRYNELIVRALKYKKPRKVSYFKENYSKPINLLKYLTRDGWPKYFAVIVGLSSEEVYGCGDKSWLFRYYRRLPIVDVMVIENASNNKISVDALLGQRSPTEGLRAQRKSKKLRSAPLARLAGNLGTLQPGRKLIVPTRITFPIPSALKSTVATLKQKPKFINYVYGPEVAVRSLVISGEKLDLEGNSANFLQLTASCECGSCPYLYAYDEQSKDWRKLGKVIHKAKGKDKEETEIRELDGLVTKFRLAEEEAELAYIDHVSLSIELKSGRKLLFEPRRTLLKRKDGLYRRIYFGQSVSVNFTMPDWLKQEDVKTSRFSVTGYYDRYSDIIQQSALQPVYSPAMLPE